VTTVNSFGPGADQFIEYVQSSSPEEQHNRLLILHVGAAPHRTQQPGGESLCLLSGESFYWNAPNWRPPYRLTSALNSLMCFIFEIVLFLAPDP